MPLASFVCFYISIIAILIHRKQRISIVALKYLFRKMADNLTEVITSPERLYYSNSKPCPAAHNLTTSTNQSFG
jgi:hypothetical protein